ELFGRLRATPSTAAVAFSTVVPVNGTGPLHTVAIDDKPVDEAPVAGARLAGAGEQFVSATYFDVLHVPLLAGRLFGAGDGPTTPPVAIVNREFAHRHFGDANPVGHRVRLDPNEANDDWLTIVGVVGDEQRASVAKEMGWSTAPVVFRPFPQAHVAAMYMLIRANADEATVT